MRIHTDVLTMRDFSQALNDMIERGHVPPHVHIDVCYELGSRSKARAFEVKLYSAKKESGDKRRRTNSGSYGAGDKWAATYDEHGWFMSAVYLRDTAAVWGSPGRPIYAGNLDFHRQTDQRYWIADNPADDGHANYPHEHGYLLDCAACETGPCVCTGPCTDTSCAPGCRLENHYAPCVSSSCQHPENADRDDSADDTGTEN